jgi:hypothetical protein
LLCLHHSVRQQEFDNRINFFALYSKNIRWKSEIVGVKALCAPPTYKYHKALRYSAIDLNFSALVESGYFQLNVLFYDQNGDLSCYFGSLLLNIENCSIFI